MQAAICQAWVRFEREHGSAEDHLQAVMKTATILERIQAEQLAAANAEQAAIAQVHRPPVPFASTTVHSAFPGLLS